MNRPRPVRPVIVGLLASLCLSGQAFALQVHQQIQGPFAAVRDVIGKCLECHRQQAEEVLQSTHWTWVRQQMVNGKNIAAGKKDSLAGFAIDVSANGSRCLRCHISTDPQKTSFDSPAADMVDCLACHDTTGQYRHNPGPDQDRTPDLVAIARNVGRPAPRNCSGCHFADCGLTPTGPLAPAPLNATALADVHLRLPGAVFTCQSCHLSGSGHNISRQMHGSGKGAGQAAACATCHTDTPHTLTQLNLHGRSITCQACHIPTYAQGAPALVAWNWLMTGKTDTAIRAGSREGLQLYDQNGFWSAANIEPVYRWDDGTDQAYSRGQKIMPQELTVLHGPAEKSEASRLAPFRVLYATQLYDSKYRYLISPLLQPEGEILFPASEWDAIARKGMEAMVLPFSGLYGFTATATFRRLNHGVAPASQALDCLDCHGATGRINWTQLGLAGVPLMDAKPAEPPQQPEQVQQVPEQTEQLPSAAPALPPVAQPPVPTGPVR